MSKLVCKPFAFLVFAEHRIKPFIRTGMFRIKLLHPLMTSLDCFFILRHLRVCFCFPLVCYGALSPQHAVFEFDAFETGEAAESPGHVFRDNVKGRDKEDAT